MTKTIKILIFLLIAFCFFISPVYAINMDLNNTSNSVSGSTGSNNSVSSNAISNDLLGTNNTLTTNTTNNLANNVNTGSNLGDTNDYEADSFTPNSSSSTNVSLLNSLPEADLGLNNILNILLIVIGILLILLGIAIIIRLK